MVFGDIGTSPLYALKTAFSLAHNDVSVLPENVYGTVSMVVWTITIIVTVKYVLLVTRADNEGQGGILALLALLRRHALGRRSLAVATVCAMAGAALFYGDSIITPAISVMSAVEGLDVVSPDLAGAVIPISAAILAALFAVQRFGTGAVGKVFGPVMFVWFVTLAGLGVPQIFAAPQILASLSPHWAISLLVREPLVAFVLLGAVVLTVTGAEALYADLGHFGGKAVRRAWLFVAMPALVVVYLGQGALVLSAPAAIENPFFHLAPPQLQLPLVIFSAVATVIASQAVISGTFAVTRQAIHLGLLPKLTVWHTSEREEGQVYLPAINWALLVGVLGLVVLFGSSSRLASAYGLAITGTLVLESAIFLTFALVVWRWRWWWLVIYISIVGALELLLFAASTTKIMDGGWLPLLVGGAVMLVMVTWQRGYRRASAARRKIEGSLAEFVDALPESVVRIPGLAVFPHPSAHTTPLAMKQCVERFNTLHQQVIIVRVRFSNVPHVPLKERVAAETVGPRASGVTLVTIRVGFADGPDIPRNLRQLVDPNGGRAFDFRGAIYVLSVLLHRPPLVRSLSAWPHRLFLFLERNQTSRQEWFHLPPSRTILLGSERRI